MAIYSLSIKPQSRSDGKNAVASIAYRHALRLEDENTGKTYDYSHRDSVLYSKLMIPAGVSFDRSRLWNMAEEAEKRKDARIGREFLLALPHELNEKKRLELAHDYARFLLERYGAAVDLAIHKPDKHGDNRNYHAHIYISTRQVTAQGFQGKTDLEKKDSLLRTEGKLTGREQIEYLREKWAAKCNEILAEAGLDKKIDHRSYARQENNQEPTSHMGKTASSLERNGIATERGEENRAIERRNQERLEVEQQLRLIEKQLVAIQHEIAVEETMTARDRKSVDPFELIQVQIQERARDTQHHVNIDLTKINKGRDY